MCYTYDNLNRVTTRTVKQLIGDLVISTETFTYDAAGNITDAPDSCFVYDTNNRLVVFNGNPVSYDMDGNMLSGNSLACTYDSANRLISAGGHTYTYNAEDVRIRNLCEDEDTTYTYNTNAKLSMLLMKTTNGVVTKYVYGRGLIGEETSGAFKTYHFDCRGSTIAITDISGNITDTFAYDTYGKCISHTGTSNIIFGYNGRDGVVTDDNGLIYMRARYYSPEMKRFINADIVAGKLSNAITLNRFAYANGNPVSFVDPFGLAAMLSRFACQAMLLDGGGSAPKTIVTNSSNKNETSKTRNGAENQSLSDIEKSLEEAFCNVSTPSDIKNASIQAIQVVIKPDNDFEIEVGKKITLLETGNTTVYFEITQSPSIDITDGSNLFESIDNTAICSELQAKLELTPSSASQTITIGDDTEVSVSYEVQLSKRSIQHSIEYAVTHTNDYNVSTEFAIGIEHTVRNESNLPPIVVPSPNHSYGMADNRSRADSRNGVPGIATGMILAFVIGAGGGLVRTAIGGGSDKLCHALY